MLVAMDNITMGDNHMLDTKFLFQPRGQGTAYLFRMATPAILIGRINPRTAKPYGKEIRESLGGVRDLKKAREERDRRLGAIREEETAVLHASAGDLGQAIEVAAWLRTLDGDGGPHDERATIESVLADEAEELERKLATKLAPKLGEAKAKRQAGEKASRWYRTATGKQTPFKTALESFKSDKGKSLSRSSLNNLDTATKEFLAFAGPDVSMEDVNRRTVAEFVTEFLPNRRGPKAPDGQGPATIRKKVSQLTQVWRWAQQRGILAYSKETPWDEQAPSAKEVEAASKKRRPFKPDETRKLFAAAPEGTTLGDASRVALMCGVRLEEIAGLDAAEVAEDARHYTIKNGKTENAARVVPLVGVAHEVIKRRLAKVKNKGPLFPELPVRKSTGKRGGAVSQAFTRLRRKELGVATDGELGMHALRHTWRTAARRAGVDLRTAHELGGWARGPSHYPQRLPLSPRFGVYTQRPTHWEPSLRAFGAGTSTGTASGT